jgi:hypothetical protein
MKKRTLLATALLAAAMLLPSVSKADPVVTNPFGNLTLSSVVAPSGTTPGHARVTIGAAFANTSQKIYFGLRLMGTEDIQMTNIAGPATGNGCIVSDFAGKNTTGKWQGADAFNTGAAPLGTPNSHMRMVGGVIKQVCGNISIDITFQTSPLVIFYGAFFGYDSAPWNSAKSGGYTTPPWNVVPTGGNAQYKQWWDLWGTFDTLGYSNACTYVSGPTATCS